MKRTALVFIAAIGCTAFAGSALACDMTQSMTDPTCANEGFPNVFNNPPPAAPAAFPESSPYDGPSYAYGPTYAYGIFGLLEGAHPTMIYPRSPIICRQGIDCPGDAAQPAPPAEATAHPPARHSRRVYRHRLTQAASHQQPS